MYTINISETKKSEKRPMTKFEAGLMHELIEEVPIEGLSLPEGHTLHDKLPLMSVYVDKGQGAHEVELTFGA